MYTANINIYSSDFKQPKMEIHVQKEEKCTKKYQKNAKLKFVRIMRDIS